MAAGLILAAGRGTRFGGRKMLAPIQGKPMLQHVLDLAAAADLRPVVVVVGDDSDEIERAMAWRHEVRVRNPDPGRGISSSVRLGLDAIPESHRVIVLLGDQPHLRLDQMRSILGTKRDPAQPIIVPRYADRRPGNPALLEREAFHLAEALEGDRGLSQLFAEHPDLVRYVDVPGTNPDIDTSADLGSVNPG